MLNLYFFIISALYKEWCGHCGYIFAASKDGAIEILKDKYKDAEGFRLRSIEQIDIKEGLTLYHGLKR